MIEQVQGQILSAIIRRFLNLREPSGRRELILKFEESAALDDLVNRALLRRTNWNPQEYLPSAAAFEFCGDVQLRAQAKFATTVVLHGLKNIYRVEAKPEGDFTLLREHIDRIYPEREFDDETLKLGLYLTRDMGVLGGLRDNDKGTETVWFQVSERIITIGDLELVWENATSGFKRAVHLQQAPSFVLPSELAAPGFEVDPPIFEESTPSKKRKRPKKKLIEDQAFLPAGSHHDAYVRIRKIVKLSKQHILIVDPYVDETLWELLSNLKVKVAIRILTNKMQNDFRLEGRKFAAQHGNTIEIRKTSVYHDRFIIEDGKRIWHVGASLKDAGGKAFALTEFARRELIKAVIADVESQWSAATIVAL